MRDAKMKAHIRSNKFDNTSPVEFLPDTMANNYGNVECLRAIEWISGIVSSRDGHQKKGKQKRKLLGERHLDLKTIAAAKAQSPIRWGRSWN